MNINWKKYSIILIDLALAVYLVLAITSFNHPDELTNVCGEVKIDIQEDVVKGFMTPDDVKTQLLHAGQYPLGAPMSEVKTRKIEEELLKNPFVETVQCYKTQTGRVYINLSQRLPVIRVKASNGDDYYVDRQGNIMPNTRYVNNLVVVTGCVKRKEAKKLIQQIGDVLIQDKLWQSQVEQLNILPNGNMEMVPRVGNHIVNLGSPENIPQKLERLEKFYKYGLSKIGWNKYDYINLEFDNQIICKKRT